MNGTNWLKTLVGGDEQAGFEGGAGWLQTVAGSDPDLCGGPQQWALSIVGLNGGGTIIQGTVSTSEQTHKGDRSAPWLHSRSCSPAEFMFNYINSCRSNHGVHLWLNIMRLHAQYTLCWGFHVPHTVVLLVLNYVRRKEGNCIKNKISNTTLSLF